MSYILQYVTVDTFVCIYIYVELHTYIHPLTYSIYTSKNPLHVYIYNVQARPRVHSAAPAARGAEGRTSLFQLYVYVSLYTYGTFALTE